MTELPGLPPFGREPVFAADDTVYATLAGHALDRRRRRVATTTAAAAALVAAVTISRPATYDRTGLEPTDQPPSATSSPSTAPRTTAVPAEPDGSARPGGDSSRPGATGRPAHGTGPGAAPATTPSPDDRAHVVSDPWCEETQSFGRCADQPRRRAEWRESSETVADRPGEQCEVAPIEGWCFRYLGPASTTAGAETAFTGELCRTANGRFAARADFQFAEELGVVLTGPPDDDDTIDHSALSYRKRVRSPHSRDIGIGTCVRWTVRWNGVTDEGAVAPAGSYKLVVVLLGRTPRDPVPGEANQERSSSHAAFVDGFVIR